MIVTSYGRNKNHVDEKNPEKANNSFNYRFAVINKTDTNAQ